MQKCPNCGYKVYASWPVALISLAFIALFLLYKNDLQRKYSWIADVALLLYVIGSAAFGILRDPMRQQLKSAQEQERQSNLN